MDISPIEKVFGFVAVIVIVISAIFISVAFLQIEKYKDENKQYKMQIEQLESENYQLKQEKLP